jgi:hypothetical protein
VRLDVVTRGTSPPRITLAGTPVTAEVRWTDREDMPFTALWIGGDRQYGIEIWIDGTIAHTVPERSDATDAVYDLIENPPAAPATPPGPPPDADQAEHTARLDAITREMRAHPGSAAFTLWEGLRRTCAVHVRNTGDLTALLDQIAHDPLIAMELMQNVRPPDVADDVYATLDQRLHNYVASAGSLVDHTRRVVKKYPGTHFAAEYETRRRAVATEPVVGFIRDLRNYAVHRALPFLGHKVSFSGGGSDITAEVLLGTPQLLAWDGWKAPAKDYLHRAGDSVDLRAAVQAHAAAVEGLNRWILAQFQGLHRTDVHALNGMRAEFNWYLSGGREGRPRA